MMSMLLTKKHKTLQHKKLSWTSQNLSKKNHFLPRPTSVLMPLWMRWKESRAGWYWIKSKGYNLYWLARNQTLLVISHPDSKVTVPHNGTHRENGEEQLSTSFQDTLICKQQLLDLSCRAVLGFRGVICSTLTHACTHLLPDICFQLRKAVVRKGEHHLSHQGPHDISHQGWCQPICQGVNTPPEDSFKTSHWETKLLPISLADVS